MRQNPEDEAEKAFREFDWRNEAWQKYFSELMPMPEAKQVEKWKRKWYHSHVDSRLSKFASTSNNVSANSTEGATSGRASASRAAPATHRNEYLTLCAVACNLAILVMAVKFALSLGSGNSAFLYRLVLFLSAVSLSIDCYSKFGLPFSGLSWLQRAMLDEPFQLLFFVMAINSSYPSIYLLFPLLIHSVLAASEKILSLRRMFEKYLQRNSFVYTVCHYVESKRIYLLDSKAYIFLFCGVSLFISLLRMRGSLVSVLLYISFIMLRYKTDARTAALFRTIDRKVTELSMNPACPVILRSTYQQVRNQIYKFASA